MILDFKRALAQSEFPELRRPNRVLQICRNSGELAEFRERYKSKSKVYIDIEAMGSGLPACMALAYNRNHGMTIPLWNVNGISNIPDADMIQIWSILDDILTNTDVVGQNFNYDRDKIKRLGFTIRKLVGDTMLKAFAINPELPKGLGFNTSIYTEELFYKDEGMYHGSTESLLEGCARDAWPIWSNFNCEELEDGNFEFKKISELLFNYPVFVGMWNRRGRIQSSKR